LTADLEVIHRLFARPQHDRLREYRYRCAQAFVFGLPVFFLHFFGQRLGGPEAARWSGTLQAALAGWVVYIGAIGMLFEGAVVLSWHRRITGDLLVALTTLLLYLSSVISLILIITGREPFFPRQFHVSVALVIFWTGGKWMILKRRHLPDHADRAYTSARSNLKIDRGE
jgi:cation transport ATPase